MTEKNVNYTADMVATMVADYNAGVTVEAIAEKVGRSVRSVVAKLSREKVYVAKTKANGAGRGATKAENVAKLESLFRVDAGSFASFEKASAAELAMLVKLVTEHAEYA